MNDARCMMFACILVINVETACSPRDPWEVPSQPSKPTILDWTPTFVDLSWIPPEKDGGSPVTAYIIGILNRIDFYCQL